MVDKEVFREVYKVVDKDVYGWKPLSKRFTKGFTGKLTVGNLFQRGLQRGLQRG